MTFPPKLLAVAAFALFFQTTIPPSAVGVPDITAAVERLTLVSALVVAVRVLWASNSKKDDQIVQMSQKVTETMVLVVESNRESRKATEELGAALDNLASNIAAMPCAVTFSDDLREGRQGTAHPPKRA
jgi:hypothetical protein